MSLFNESGNASIDNQNAVSSLSFYFLKKFQFNEKASKSFIQRYFPLPFQITTTNKPIKDERISILYFPIAHNTLCLPPKFCINHCL